MTGEDKPSMKGDDHSKTAVRNSRTIYAAAVAIVVIVIAIVALFAFNSGRHANVAGVSGIKSGKTISVSNFSSLIGSGFNTSEYTVSYTGTISINASGISASAPVNITAYKNGTAAKVVLEVNPLPVFGGNMSQQYIKNGTLYYTCSKIVGGRLSNQSTSTYSCIETNQSSSIFGAFDYSSSNLTVNESTLGTSDYNGMPCSSVYGLIKSVSYGSQIIGGGISAKANILACISRSWDMPLNISIGLAMSNATAASNVYISLHETRHSNVSPSGITALSGPLITQAPSISKNFTGFNITTSCYTGAVPQPDKIICTNALLYTNGSLVMNMESSSNAPLYIHDMVCNSDSNYSVSNLGGYINGIRLNSTPGNAIEVNNTFTAAIRCKNLNGTFGFTTGEQFYGGFIIAYANSSLASTYSVAPFELNVTAENSVG